MNKKNIPVILGISIPIVMVLLIVLTIYLPRSLVKPSHNFLFTLGPQNAYRLVNPAPGSNMVAREQQIYDVKDGKVVVASQTYYYYPGDTLDVPNKLYLYDVKENKSREVTVDEVKSFKIDPSTIAPDGFEITFGNRGGGFFPFFYEGSDYNSRYLKKGISSQKLNMPSYSGSNYYYDNNFRLLGWVVN